MTVASLLSDAGAFAEARSGLGMLLVDRIGALLHFHPRALSVMMGTVAVGFAFMSSSCPECGMQYTQRYSHSGDHMG